VLGEDADSPTGRGTFKSVKGLAQDLPGLATDLAIVDILEITLQGQHQYGADVSSAYSMGCTLAPPCEYD